MKSVLRVLLLCLVAFIAIGFAFVVLFQPPLQGVLRPVLSVCILLVLGCALYGIDAAFTKRHTTATGFG